MENIYHEGELEIQKKFGEDVKANRVGRMVKKTVIPGAVPFLESQKTAILSSRDADGNIWASFITGKKGFIQLPQLDKVRFDRSKIQSTSKDILYDNITLRPEVGSIFIELATQRRYRVNGRLLVTDNNLDIEIDEAYPNCPKYIQRRLGKDITTPQIKTPLISKGEQLTPQQIDWIRSADTLFVGTQSSDLKLDASHRGGNPGFVEVLADGALKIPDYQGNMMYNTLGNIAQNGKAGLLFIDYKKRNVLQLSGTASLLFDQHNELDDLRTTGTGRYWLFETKAWIQTDKQHDLDWEYMDASPFNPAI